MSSFVNRSLITLFIFAGSLYQANAQSSAAQASSIAPSNSGWTWLQDTQAIFCAGNVTSCTITTGNIVATTAGSVWVLQVQTPNNVSMANVTGGGGTWVHCPNCYVHNPSGFTTDAWYNLSGNAGTSSGITFSLSGGSGAFVSVNFYELLPPPGTTASYDASGTATPTNCTVCTGPSLTLSGTDAVVINPGGNQTVAGNGWSSPFITDSNGAGIGLDIPSGAMAAPTVTYVGNSNPELIAIAFKSSAGNFVPPARQYSMVNFFTTGKSCTPSCSITVPSTGTNHLLYLEDGNQGSQHIVSVTGGGTWVVPTQCQVGAVVQGQHNYMSCAYVLSSSSGATTLNITMSGNASNNFGYYEIASTSGNFSLDAIANTVNSTASGFYFPGQPLTLGGANDVIFQASWDVGGSLGPTLYPISQSPYNSSTNSGTFNYIQFNESAIVVLLDSALVQSALGLGSAAPVPEWINAVNNQTTFVSGVAFTASGTSSGAPSPPSALTAVVN